ncbi:MAG: ATP-binding protein [Lachnospiraceae bacterium]|nr:ATP-binding protein [Lachnospiraceae bacterium]
MERDYTLKVSPRMLELLSKDLYTNMYFVLAELIANAYDADAENVYIFIDDNEIRVEDDGDGMSGDILDEKYLLVGGESRTCEDDAKTVQKKRLKMGRKGIGKLAALSISDGFKLITVQESKPIGLFIPHRIEHDDEKLKVLSSKEYELKKITNKGTAIIMENPKVTIPKLHETVLNNLAKIFPNNIADFNIYVIYKGNSKKLVPDEKKVINRLGTFMSIGNEKRYLEEELSKEDKSLQILQRDAITQTIEMLNSKNELQSLDVRIYGWIGTYKTSRGMKKEINEFSDNYLAIFAHNKMGLRNVLPIVSRNRVYENYIVGNLYIDAFEAPDFPDMAGTNRQGYNENDLRWKTALEYIRNIVDEIVKSHTQFATMEKSLKEAEKESKKEAAEKKLKEKLDSTTKNIVQNLVQKIQEPNSGDTIEKYVSDELETIKPLLGFKATVDANKKKIMISQTLNDMPVSNVIYQSLLFNGVPKEDIIYSNGPDPETNLPEKDIYGYLQKFFVQSASSEMIYVLFVTSKNVVNVDPNCPSVSWGELMEIGAAWVTRKDHWVFNVDGFKPEPPLNISNKWVDFYTIATEDGTKILSLTEAMANSFCNKILETCQVCGYTPKTFEENKKNLIDNYITIHNI